MEPRDQTGHTNGLFVQSSVYVCVPLHANAVSTLLAVSYCNWPTSQLHMQRYRAPAHTRRPPLIGQDESSSYFLQLLYTLR